jgi:hypothetical protein
MSIKIGRRMNYRLMIILALIVGVLGIAAQFMPGWEGPSFLLSIVVLGGLIGGNNDYEELDRQRLGRSFKTAYEWMLLIIMSAYAFILLSGSLHMEGPVIFLNSHWPGLIISMMCILLGIAGFDKRQKIEGPAQHAAAGDQAKAQREND